MKKQIGQIALFTLIFYFIFSPLQNFASSGDPRYLWKMVASIESFAIFISTTFSFFLYTLGAYLIFFYAYPKQSISRISVMIVASIIVVISSRYLIEEVAYDYLLGFTNYYGDPSLHYYFFDNLYYAFVFTSFGIILFFIRYTRYRDMQRAQYEIEQQKTQLSLLRSQINPHFIFNALNGIYTLVHDKNEKALPALETLSNLLRYSLYQKEEQVELKKEWAFIEDYLRLQESRLSKPLAILMDVPTQLPQLKILAFCLIPFVENVVKHGELVDSTAPVRLHLSTTSTHFLFSLKNKIKHQHKDSTGGIGLENTKKRLELFYDNAHDLSIKTNDNTFNIELKIPLNLC